MNNKFRAKLTIKDNKEAQNIVKAFFDDLNSESCFRLKGNTAEMIISFREKPYAIIEAITTNGSDLEFSYNEDLFEKYEEAKINKSKSNSYDKLKESNQKDGKIKVEASKDNTSTTSYNQDESEPIFQSDIAEIMNSMLKKSKSIEDFVESLITFLKLKGTAVKKFREIAIYSAKAEKISWKELDKKRKTCYKDRDIIGKQISEQFKTKITLLEFLKNINKLKTYSFTQNNIGKKEESEPQKGKIISKELKNKQKDKTLQSKKENYQEKENIQANQENVEILKQSRITELKCFEEIFSKIDKGQPIQDRIQFVLESIGLDKRNPEEREWILEIANNAIKQKDINNSFNLNNNIPKEQKKLAQMVFSDFINAFLHKYEVNKIIKTIDFLKELQNKILTDSEKERLLN